jgi:hypothetical protein
MTFDLANFIKNCVEHLQKAIPVLATLDIVKMGIFFQKRLDFKLVGTDKGNAIMPRDTTAIHLSKSLDKIPPEKTSRYVKFQVNETLSHLMPANSAVQPNAPVRSRPADMPENAILDRDGNCTKFG